MVLVMLVYNYRDVWCVRVSLIQPRLFCIVLPGGFGLLVLGN